MVLKDHVLVKRVKFFKCPKNYQTIWAKRLNRQGLNKLSDNQKVCSNHFVIGQPTEKYPHPELYLEGYEEDATQDFAVLADMRRALSSSHLVANELGSGDDEKKRFLKRKIDETKMAQQMFQNMISGKDFDIEHLQIQHVNLLEAFSEMQAEATKLRAENEKLEDALQSDFSKLSYRFLKCDNKQLQFLTGLNTAAFDWLIPKIARSIFRVHPEVTPQDHLLIVLMKLNLGLCDDDLGYRFQISGGIITAICQTWIPTLAVVLCPLIEWPSQDTIVKTRPSIFKGRARRCRCIIDTLKVSVATPNASTKVVSYLIGATPAGAISFVSPGFFCRKKSDKQLIRESGFMDVLKPNDLLLTTNALPVQKELDAIGVTLLTPDIAGGKRSATTKTVDFPVAVWSSVEKVMNWWKDFGIFQTPIPEAYEEMLNDVVVACAALTNLKMSLVPQVNNTKKCNE